MKFVMATHNAHKKNEFKRILAPLGVEIVDANFSEPVEDGETFAENARIKAKSACVETGLPAIADDSGICVDALDGAPGVHSARYGGEGLSDEDRVQLLLKEMQDVAESERGAHFTCSICCVFPNGDTLVAEGKCFGTIGYTVAGKNGFGYDPIFMQGEISFAQLSDKEKDERSHRGQALRAFSVALENYIAEKEVSNANK